MLDTNIASYIIKNHHPEIRNRLLSVPIDSITISAITQGELLYGLARKGRPANLAKLIREFLFRVEIFLGMNKQPPFMVIFGHPAPLQVLLLEH
jgi:tRNA(fMet)-specific endonuclease VapC